MAALHILPQEYMSNCCSRGGGDFALQEVKTGEPHMFVYFSAHMDDGGFVASYDISSDHRDGIVAWFGKADVNSTETPFPNCNIPFWGKKHGATKMVSFFL